jgi:hypothetical protein
MARRALSTDEASSLGLPDAAPAPARRALSADEAQGLGLPDAGPAAPRMGSGSSAGGAALRGFGQGLTAGFGDEMGAGLQSGLQGLVNALPSGALDWAGIDNRQQQDVGDVYQHARSENRAQLATDEQEHGAASALGNVAGGVLLNAIVPGEGTYAQAIGLGAASGLGNSEADLTQRDVGGALKDTAIGGALGAAGKYVGDKAASGAGAVRQWVLNKAGTGKAAAAALSTAQAAAEKAKETASLRGEAGAAASRAAQAVQNIEKINLPEDVPRRTVGEVADSIRQQLASLDSTIAEARAKAVASGIAPDNLGAGRMGEFLARGSKFDKAQQAARKLGTYQDARDALAQQLDELLTANRPDALMPDTAGPLREAQAALQADPRFLDLKQNVLKNTLNDFPAVADQALAARSAYHEAIASTPEDVAKRSAVLLSPDAAKERAKQLALRYGLPALGGYLGSQIGGVEGAAVGAAAGAGARPGLQALYRTATTNPAVQHAAFSALESLAKSTPQSFGKWSRAVAQAAARGPEAIATMDKVLRDTDPDWRQMRGQQEQDARQ